MAEKIIHFISGFGAQPAVTTFFMAMLPITELRLAIPWALTIGDMGWAEAYTIAIAGNFAITIPIVYFLEPVSLWLRKWEPFDRFFDWLFTRTRRKGKLIEKVEFWGLVVFVGIPLPVTGAWTGAVAGFVFGLKRKKAVMAILIGLFMSATIVTLLTLFGEAIVNRLN